GLRQAELHRHRASQLKDGAAVVGDGRQEAAEGVEHSESRRLCGRVTGNVAGSEREGVRAGMSESDGITTGHGAAIERGICAGESRERVAGSEAECYRRV